MNSGEGVLEMSQCSKVWDGVEQLAQTAILALQGAARLGSDLDGSAMFVEPEDNMVSVQGATEQVLQMLFRASLEPESQGLSWQISGLV